MKMISRVFLIFVLFVIQVSCSNDHVDSSGEDDPDTDNIEVRPGMTLVGTVFDKDKNPVVGAVVSDGYSVVQTDESGVYQMAQNSDAQFVSISVPSEYEVPMSGGLPKMYYELKELKQGVVNRQNFTLKKTTKENSFTLLAFADIQVGHEGDLDSLATQIPLVEEYIKTIEGPVYGISLGDMVWDNMPYHDDYVNYIKKFDIPMFHVIGNHDFDKNITEEKHYADNFKSHFGPVYYSYNRGDCHFIVLDDVAYQGAGTYAKYISENQMEWLKQDLKYVSKDKLIILGVHVPTQKRNLSHHIQNYTDLYNLFDGYTVRILSGHIHTNESITISGTIEENNFAAFKGAGWTGDLCSDGSPRGFGIYKIEGNKIMNWFYKGTAHPVGYQMYIYKPGEAVSTQYRDGVVINIFAWHTNWKSVNVLEDGTIFANGKLMETSKNITDYDRRAYDYMAGGDKPAHWKSAEPYEYNDHMFYYKPNSNWEKIVVEIEDAYGNKYKDSIQNN
ncbi:MAG: calcineurin-like phosphoesterase family protein [Bacteroides sp.]|jgi:hypothetical protein|nr:calcineurin-like phosphoesterase family protein [Bacteroides sp.]